MTNKQLKWHFHLLDIFLLFVPVSIIFYFLHAASLPSFLITAAALIGMAHLMAESTSIIANRVSSTISALINATFGNAVELFIAVFSLRAGLFALVTASITGSILLNVLLLIGLAMLAGGLKFKEQKFNKDSAGLSSTMLFVAVVGLSIPSLYKMMVGTPSHQMSLAVSGILGIVYILSLIYTLVTHRHMFVVERQPPEENHDRWTEKGAIVVLLVITILAGFASDILVNSIQPLVGKTGFTDAFVGLVFVAILTNIPEITSAMAFARKNHMTLSLEIGMSSALQIALFVVPILILVSPLIVHGGFDLVFTPFELVAVVVTAMIANYIGADGICHWVEGAQLIAVYLLMATAFYFLK
ncbi:MAG: calcium/proton exchanger [Dehalococcoidales bacterium]